MPTCAAAIEQLFASESGLLTAPEVIDRLYARWPDRPWKETTIRQHLIGMSLNHTSAHHMAQLAHRAFLHWTPGGHYRRWDPAKDGAPPPSLSSGVRPQKPTPALPDKPPKAATVKPWAATPAGMLRHAGELLHSSADALQKQAFLEIDNAVELLIKGYLSQAGAARPRLETFAERLSALDEAAAGIVKKDDLRDIGWYHGLRNQLYHDGSGLTVERKIVEAYLGLAEALLTALDIAPAPRAVPHAR